MEIWHPHAGAVMLSKMEFLSDNNLECDQGKKMAGSKSVSIQLLSTLAICALLLSSADSFYGTEEQSAAAAPEVLLAPNEALDAFFDSQYDYLDASILASFLQSSPEETKTVMGTKILSGPVGKALLAQKLVDARISALGSAAELRYFVDEGYSYEDAEALAEFWGEPSPYEAKVRVERNLILDQKEAIDTALLLASN